MGHRFWVPLQAKKSTHTHTYARDRGMASSDPKGAVLAST